MPVPAFAGKPDPDPEATFCLDPEAMPGLGGGTNRVFITPLPLPPILAIFIFIALPFALALVLALALAFAFVAAKAAAITPLFLRLIIGLPSPSILKLV